MSKSSIYKSNYYSVPPAVEFADGVTASKLNCPDNFPEDTGGASVDVLKFKANHSLPEHIHPERNHSLVVVRGLGWVSIKGNSVYVSEGDVVDIVGADIHAIGARSRDLWVLSIGTPPADIFDPNRMTFVDGMYRPRVPVDSILSKLISNK